MRKALLAALALLLTASSAGAQDSPPWPSVQQLQRVHDLRAAFPVDRYVADVAWYQPQEVVRGVRHPAPLPVRDPRHRTIGAQALANAVAYADAQKSFALLVWHHGALELEHYAPGFDRSSRYETSSMAKPVMALALGAAIREGKIAGVDDPIERYLPALRGTRRGAVSLRGYLEMVSGIETPPGNGADDSPYWQYYFGNDLLQTVAHWPDSCTAKTEFCYANANSQLLGYAIVAATGMRYADWLSTRIWRPIGAGDAGLWLDHPGGMPRVSCCLMARAQDWLRVGMLMLQKGRADGRLLLPADWVASMSAPSPANPNFGWQVWRGSPHNPARHYGPHLKTIAPAVEPFARDDVVYFDGSAGQRLYVIPSADMVIVRIGAPSHDWDDSHLPNLLLAGLG